MRTDQFMCSRMMMKKAEKQEKPGQGIPHVVYLPMDDRLSKTARESATCLPDPTAGSPGKAKQ